MTLTPSSKYPLEYPSDPLASGFLLKYSLNYRSSTILALKSPFSIALLQCLHLDLLDFAASTQTCLYIQYSDKQLLHAHIIIIFEPPIMSSEHFRRLLQHFYIKINTGHHADVYKKILVQLFDEVEVQPIHILALSEQPSVKNFNKNGVAKIIDRKKQALYKNTDFASVFLFGYLMGVLKRHDTQELKNLQARVMDNLDIFYGEKQSEDATKYKFVFEGIFQFCQYVMMHNYESSQIEKIFKSFYSNTFERRGLKKTQKQKYLTESQVFLSFILGQSGTYPSKKQICQPNSDIYELNSLQFCIVIDNVEGGEQWTIGQGQHHINIVKEKGQYTIYQQFLDKQEEHDDEMNEIWLQILSQSQHIRKQHNDRTTNLMTDLNIMEQICSPTKSVRSPKTDLLKGRKRIGDFF